MAMWEAEKANLIKDLVISQKRVVMLREARAAMGTGAIWGEVAETVSAEPFGAR